MLFVFLSFIIPSCILFAFGVIILIIGGQLLLISFALIPKKDKKENLPINIPREQFLSSDRSNYLSSPHLSTKVSKNNIGEMDCCKKTRQSGRYYCNCGRVVIEKLPMREINAQHH